MDEQMLRELEAAAQILLAPPNLVNEEQRHAAETVFMNFRKSKTPYSTCKQILETSRVDYVLFEVAGVIKTALIKDWRYLQDEEKVSLREYLFKYVVERSSALPAFVRERILQVIAILIKRQSIDDMGVALAQLLTQIENLVFSGDHLRQILGCNLMGAIMQEFAITSKSSSVGVSWEDHHQAKKRFQNVDLKRIFQFCCRALSGLLNSEEQLNQQATALLKSLLALAESVLSWKFFSLFFRRLMPSVEASAEVEPYSPLRGLSTWADVYLDPNVVNMFFTLYWKIRMNPQLAHHGMTCMVQLSSLGGPVLSARAIRMQYITNYLENFIKLVTSVQILDREALGTSYIIFQIVSHYPIDQLLSLQSPLAQSFFEQFTKITCDFAMGAAQEESMCAEDRLYMEGFDRLMISWVHILSASPSISEELQENVCQQIFNTYVKLHIGPPDGSRGSGRELEAEELEENEETDRSRFNGQLEAVGLMGRTVPHHSVQLLAQLLEQRTRNLTALLQKFHQQEVNISDSSAILVLFEDIHWLVLIAGFLVSVDGDGDSVTVPMALMKYSIKQAADVETSLRVFGSPYLDIKDVPNGELHTDHLIRLITAVFRLAHVFKDALQSNTKLTEFLSPEVASSVLWFLQRWSTSYLLLDEERFADLSPVLVSCHGRDSNGGVWASRFLLDHSLAHITHFHAEPTVIQDAVKLLTSLVQNRDKRNALTKNEGLESLLQLPPRLPTHVKRAIYQTLAAAGLAVIEGDLDKSYWVRLLQPLQDRFKAFINREDSARSYQEEHVKTELLDILECLIGITKGARASTVPDLFSYLSPILAELPHLIHVYRNYQTVVESIITLHWEFAENILTHLTRVQVNRFYNICMELIRTYAKCNRGRLSLETDSLDDTFQDVLLILMLLTDLLVKDLLNHSPPDADGAAENEPIVTASDVCLNGVFLIMPLMSHELLKYPELCLKYYKLLHYLADIFPDIVLQLSDTYLSKIFYTVEIGLNTFGANVVAPCCNFIYALAQHVAKHTPEGVAYNPVLLPFLKITMDFVLSQHISSELIRCSSAALFALICCYRTEYNQLVQQLILSQPEAQIAERLVRAFTSLTEDMPLVPTRQNLVRFSSKFDQFITEVYGFLCIR